MKLGMLAAVATLSVAGGTGASAQVYVADPYYVAPAPVYTVPAPVVGPGYVVTEPAYPIGGYVPPRYSYTVNDSGIIYSTYRAPGGCSVGLDGYRYCY
jgi:hypothetical protein